MLSSRRWLVIFCALFLGSANLFAASREERAYKAALAAFQDGLWERAEADLAQFAQRFPKSGHLAESVLMEARAEFQQGKYSDALALLNAQKSQAGALADRYAYWTGETQLAQNDLAAAGSTFLALSGSATETSLKLMATVAAADVYEKTGRWTQLEELLAAPDGVFARIAGLDAENELVSRGWLLLAQSRFERRDFPGALATLGRLHPQALSPGLDWQRLYLTARAQLGKGDLEGALASTTQMLSGGKNPGRRADATALRATLLEKLDQPTAAAVAWMENLSTEVPASQQQEAILKIAALALAQNQLSNAVAGLENFLPRATAPALRELALLTLGELTLKDFSNTNHLEAALARFNQLLEAAPDSALAGRACLGRGWCRWLAGETAASLKDFQTAAARLPLSEEQAVARFKAGDAQYVLSDFAGARENYRAVAGGYPGLPAVGQSLGARALYQCLRADLQLRDASGAEQTVRQLLEKFPKSELVDNSLLLMGEGFSDFSSADKARAIFEQFLALAPDSPLRPQVELALARTHEREQNWAAALEHYENWVRQFPTNALLPQAEYARAWAAFQAGDEPRAFGLFTRFVARFPAEALAPLAQWWVADACFRSGTNYQEAEKNYELVFQTPAWRQATNLYYQAQLMAGRAAAARLGFSDAARYFAGLTGDTNCPPALATQAMFAYGSVLMRMDPADSSRPLANFELATNVFGQICLANPTNELCALAGSELAKCYQQLGLLDAATNAYAGVVHSPQAKAGLRSRARVGLGLTLEKKAALLPLPERAPLLKQALDEYRDVLYGSEAPADPFWVKKAGLEALRLMVELKDGDVDRFFDRLEFWLPTLKPALEKKRAALNAAKN